MSEFIKIQELKPSDDCKWLLKEFYSDHDAFYGYDSILYTVGSGGVESELALFEHESDAKLAQAAPAMRAVLVDIAEVWHELKGFMDACERDDAIPSLYASDLLRKILEPFAMHGIEMPEKGGSDGT